MTDWVRLWHDMPTDPKWRVIARRSEQPLPAVIAVFTMLMVEASRAADRGNVSGFRHEEAAAALDLADEDVSAIVDAMQGRVIIENRLSGWERRQPKREDDSSARVKRHREERKGVVAKRNVTHRNAPYTDTDTDTSEAIASGTIVPRPAFDFCKAVFESGKALLTAAGKTPREAGSIIGRWRKSCGDAELLTLIRQSEAEGHSDPVAWLTAAVETRHGNRSSSSIRGSRPDPALDMWRDAQRDIAAESAGRDTQADFGAGLPLSPYLAD